MSIIISAIIVVASGGSALGIFLAGAASGGIMTGTWQGAFKGGLFALFSAGIAQGVGDAFFNSFGLEHGATLFSSTKVGVQALRAIAHGLSRGVISMAQGGTFKSGFASGFASSFFNPGTTMGGDGAGGFTLRTTIAGVAGGTASEIGGGKFSNGAISGAFVHMFNAEGRAAIANARRKALQLSTDKIIASFEKMRSLPLAQRLMLLYKFTKNGSMLDFKQEGSKYQDYGNFTFGAVGSALDIDDAILLRGAGWAQIRAGTSQIKYGSPYGLSPYGDDPIDQQYIEYGINYYRNQYVK